MQKFSLCLFALFPVVNQLLKRKWDAAWVIEPRCNASAQAFYSNNTRMTQLLDGYHRSSNKRPSNFSVRFPIALFAIRDAEVYTGCLIVLQLIGVLISNNQTNDIQREKRRRTGPSDILRRYVECGTLSSSSNMAYRTILHLDSEIKKKKVIRTLYLTSLVWNKNVLFSSYFGILVPRNYHWNWEVSFWFKEYLPPYCDILVLWYVIEVTWEAQFRQK